MFVVSSIIVIILYSLRNKNKTNELQKAEKIRTTDITQADSEQEKQRKAKKGQEFLSTNEFRSVNKINFSVYQNNDKAYLPLYTNIPLREWLLTFTISNNISKLFKGRRNFYDLCAKFK